MHARRELDIVTDRQAYQRGFPMPSSKRLLDRRTLLKNSLGSGLAALAFTTVNGGPVRAQEERERRERERREREERERRERAERERREREERERRERERRERERRERERREREERERRR
jgi:hypothetical protein